jgi:hypothetical protein
MEWLEWLLPTRLPFLHLKYTPAELLHLFITHKIEGFQAGVAKRAAARAADPRYASLHFVS